MVMVETFRRLFKEFLYPPPPNHFEPWRSAWQSIRGLTYDGLLVICKLIIVLITSYGINILIRKRRTEGRDICTSIVRHPVSIFILRFWLPLRLLCPSLLFELGIHLCTAIDKLPRSINCAITTGLTKTAVYLEWMEIIVITSFLYCLLEAPITHAVVLFGRWCAKYDIPNVTRRKRQRRNVVHSIIRVVEEPSTKSTVRRR